MGHHVSLKHLRCFLAVANSGSFTAAAEKLYLTQSALTSAIQQFEEAVGQRMFDRTTRRVALSPLAHPFKEVAEKIVSDFDTAVANLIGLAHGQKGHVRIGAASSVINQMLTHVIPRFREAHPTVTLSLHDPAARYVARMVRDAEVDFGIDSRHQSAEDLVYTPLVSDRYGVACHRDSPLGQVTGPIGWHELEPAGYVAFGADTGIGECLRQHAGELTLLANPREEITSARSLPAVLGLGNRYSILPAMTLLGPDCSDFMFRELVDPVLSREICLITKKSRPATLEARQFLNVLFTTLQMPVLPEDTHVLTDRMSADSLF
jgi:DNA-binding transcriptional LysR family regulator